MPQQVCMGAMLKCSFGLAPSSLIVIPKGLPVLTGTPAATIMDFIPIANILPFGLCTSPMNPAVIALTIAAFGVPKPAPCVPMTPSPWIPGAVKVKINGFPALSSTSVCNCAWGGIIQIMLPGQFTISIV
jgi:hypothetical protein